MGKMMKKRILALYLMLLMGTAVASQTVMVDPYFSPYSGAANLMTAQDLLIMGEDRLFPRG